MNHELRIGIVGAGDFAAFAAHAFQKVSGISIGGVTDIEPNAATQLAQALGTIPYLGYEDMLADTSIDLIYIATPPYLHYQQSMMALKAGKHVICEKPAALKTKEAEALAAFAKAHKLLYVVNLMQRYNPLYQAVHTIIKSKWLGGFVHGFFENYASDEKLILKHWFWDKTKSGGIFIEHGVHFFDMFQGWLGPGKIIHAMAIRRSGIAEEVIDRVQAVVMYPEGPVNFYHGFNQPKILDRQELRLQFDHGDITLYEWIPVKIRLHGLIKKETLEKLRLLFPEGSIEHHTKLSEDTQTVRGKFRDITFDSQVTLTSGEKLDKMERYEYLIMEMLRDQWAWLQDRSHKRVIDATHAVSSLGMAEEATIKSVYF